MVVGDHAFDRRLGHQQGLDHRCRTTGTDQHLEHIVQRGGVRSSGLDHRLDDAVVGPEGLSGHADFVAAHPAGVAAQGVDLAVVGQHPERLGQPPFGEGVGRIALVEQGDIGLDPRVVEIRIEVRQRLGQHHPLVDDRPRRQRADVEMLQARGRRPRLDPATQQVQRPLQFLAIQTVRRAQHDLFDLGPGRGSPLTEHRHMGRHLPPAIEPEARRHHLALDDGPRPFLRRQIDPRQEDHADGDRTRPGLVPGVAHLGLEERARQADQYAGAVTRLAVRIDGAPVPDGLQRLERQIDDLTARLSVDGGDKTHAAGVAFGRRVIGVAVDQPLSVTLVLFRIEAHAATF